MRHSDVRKQLERVSKEAHAAEKALSRLRDAFHALDSEFEDWLRESLDLIAKIAVSLVSRQEPWFPALSQVADVADRYANVLRGADKGGPPKMAAFQTLVFWLGLAFKRATGRPAKVTWNAHRGRYEGHFLLLVEAVLPLARRLAGSPERPIRCPDTEQARGKYVYELTRAGAGKNKKKSGQR
jgi:hypothetical protein